MPAAALGPAARAAAKRVRLLKFVTLFAIGGTERQVVTLASGLDASRFHLHLACLRRTGELLDRDIFRSAPPVEYGITNLYNGQAFVERLKFAAYLRRNRIQIVHTYSFYPNVFAIAAARLARTPVVIASIRDMGVYLTPLQLRVQRVVCRLAHRIVVNAEAVKQWLVADGYDGSKITVIPNGVELSRFRQPADGSGLRRELGLPGGCPLVAVGVSAEPEQGPRGLPPGGRHPEGQAPGRALLARGAGVARRRGIPRKRSKRALRASGSRGGSSSRASGWTCPRSCRRSRYRYCPRSAKGCPTCCWSPWPLVCP